VYAVIDGVHVSPARNMENQHASLNIQQEMCEELTDA
jgi:hypothetical protein